MKESYTMLTDVGHLKKGDVVYHCHMSDYGLANDASRHDARSGEYDTTYRSMTTDPNHGYPSQVVESRQMRKNVEPVSPPVVVAPVLPPAPKSDAVAVADKAMEVISELQKSIRTRDELIEVQRQLIELLTDKLTNIGYLAP